MFENLLTFANQIRIGMETITLSFEPDSDFAVALDELIRNSDGVRVVRRGDEDQQIKIIEESLSPEELETAYRMASSVKTSLKEVNDAASNGDCVGRSADEFLCELLEEQS